MSSTTDITKVLKFCSRETSLYLQTWDDQSVGEFIWHGNEQLATVSVTNEHFDSHHQYPIMFDDDLSSFWHSRVTSRTHEFDTITIIFKVSRFIFIKIILIIMANCNFKEPILFEKLAIVKRFSCYSCPISRRYDNVCLVLDDIEKERFQ